MRFASSLSNMPTRTSMTTGLWLWSARDALHAALRPEMDRARPAGGRRTARHRRHSIAGGPRKQLRSRQSHEVVPRRTCGFQSATGSRDAPGHTPRTHSIRAERRDADSDKSAVLNLDSHRPNYFRPGRVQSRGGARKLAANRRLGYGPPVGAETVRNYAVAASLRLANIMRTALRIAVIRIAAARAGEDGAQTR